MVLLIGRVLELVKTADPHENIQIGLFGQRLGRIEVVAACNFVSMNNSLDLGFEGGFEADKYYGSFMSNQHVTNL